MQSIAQAVISSGEKSLPGGKSDLSVNSVCINSRSVILRLITVRPKFASLHNLLYAILGEGRRSLIVVSLISLPKHLDTWMLYHPTDLMSASSVRISARILVIVAAVAVMMNLVIHREDNQWGIIAWGIITNMIHYRNALHRGLQSSSRRWSDHSAGRSVIRSVGSVRLAIAYFSLRLPLNVTAAASYPRDSEVGGCCCWLSDVPNTRWRLRDPTDTRACHVPTTTSDVIVVRESAVIVMTYRIFG